MKNKRLKNNLVIALCFSLLVAPNVFAEDNSKLPKNNSGAIKSSESKMQNSRSKMTEDEEAREVIYTETISLSNEKLSRLVVDSGKTLEMLATKSGSKANRLDDTILSKAECIAIFPNIITVAVGVGGQHGDGVISCRGTDNRWSQIGFLDLRGASIGLQLGAKSTSAVILINDKEARSKLEKGSLKLAANASAVIGTSDIGKNYVAKGKGITIVSDSKGAFAGASIEGAYLNIDETELKEFYDENATYSSVIATYDIPNEPLVVKEFIQLMPKGS